MSKKGGQFANEISEGLTVYKHQAPKYPNYYEPKIDFQPTYKRNFNDNKFKNKKS